MGHDDTIVSRNPFRPHESEKSYQKAHFVNCNASSLPPSNSQFLRVFSRQASNGVDRSSVCHRRSFEDDYSRIPYCGRIDLSF